MSSKDSEINLSFIIYDFDDITHQDITNTLGVSPYEVYIKGERINPNKERLSKRNGWVLGTSYADCDDFDTRVEKILDVLEPNILILKTYAQKYYCEFNCAVFLGREHPIMPKIKFSKRLNEFIAGVNVEFEFDIFY